MNISTEIPKKMKTQSDIRASIAAIRTPWHRWQTSFLQTASVAVMVCWYFVPSSFIPDKWSRGGFAVVLLVLWTLNQYYRDKAWRRLIELEAPELHRKISGTDV